MIKNLAFAAGMFLFCLVGVPQKAAAQASSPSQFCKTEVEPAFQELGVPIGHSTCVTLVNGANGNDVGVCKWARDLGAINNNELGKCISSGIPDLDSRIIAALENYGTAGEEALLIVDEIIGVGFGPTTLSIAVFAALLGGWVFVQLRRRKVLSQQLL